MPAKARKLEVKLDDILPTTTADALGKLIGFSRRSRRPKKSCPQVDGVVGQLSMMSVNPRSDNAGNRAPYDQVHGPFAVVAPALKLAGAGHPTYSCGDQDNA